MFRVLSALCLMLLAASLSVTAAYSQVDVNVLALDWSPDGTQIVTGNSAGDLEIWSVDAGTLVRTLRGHTQEIMTLEWSPDGTRIASGSPDGSIRIWDVVNGETTRIIQFSQPDALFRAILDIAWSPDSTLVVGAFETGYVAIWDVGAGQQLASYVHGDIALRGTALTNMVLTVAWRPLGDTVASGGLLGDMLLWDVTNQSPSEFAPINLENFGPVDSITWSPNGENIAIGTRRGGVQVFDFSAESLSFQIPQPLQSIVSLQWSPSGEELAISNLETVTIVDTSTGLIVDSVEGTAILDDVAWSPYGGRLAVRNSEYQPATRLGNAVQIVVPAPSLERLQAIADACDAPATLTAALRTDAALLSETTQAAALAAFVAQVEALPAEAIPPACAADLRAVAEALGAG
jgi:WD40 repeat protein